jgi:excisionase family DNA binding protein
MNVFADSSTLSLSQAAQRLGVSLGTIRCWSDLGYLDSHRTQAGQLRFRREDIDAFAGSSEHHRSGPVGARRAI